MPSNWRLLHQLSHRPNAGNHWSHCLLQPGGCYGNIYCRGGGGGKCNESFRWQLILWTKNLWSLLQSSERQSASVLSMATCILSTCMVGANIRSGNQIYIFTFCATRLPSGDSLSLRNITSPQELARASRSPSLLVGALWCVCVCVCVCVWLSKWY